jgi:protein arginine N-methyltransferase 1
MYDIVEYAGMIAFEERTSAYARAVEANIVPRATVLDIGCGPGILSLLACRAGASKVYAVEPNDIIQLARETAADNGLLNRIEFIQALSTEIELPERVDGIVADIHGVLPLHGKSIISILDARDRLLKHDGWIIPRRETIWAALSSCPVLHSSLIDGWNKQYDFDFARARLQATNGLRAARLKADDLVVQPQPWAVLDYKQLHGCNVNGKMFWVMDRNVTAHGICAWYDCETAEGAGFSNSPAANGPFVYRHAFFPWPEALELEVGDQVEISLRADFVDPDYVWAWNTRVTNDSGQERARYRQSTFIGAPLSPERLRKRAASFVPRPNDDSRVDCQVLELMRRNISLGEIAKVLLAGFPERFKNWNAALARAADLSEKYSR